MKNLSNQEQNASSLLQWKLKDNNGRQYNARMNPAGPAGPDGKFEAEALLKGTLSFEADILSSGRTIWGTSV